MSTLLYTGYDTPYSPLADITVPRMAKYTYLKGMDFKVYTEPLLHVPNGIYWTGVCGALEAFRQGYDRVFYLDVDQLITNMDCELASASNGIHLSKDWGEDAIHPWQFSMCGFIASRDTEHVFYKALEMEQEWRDKPFPEQGPMQNIMKGMIEGSPLRAGASKGALFNVWPRKVFNCVPEKVCPGSVPEPWAPGDFAAHLTMLQLDGRIKLAQDILKQIS